MRRNRTLFFVARKQVIVHVRNFSHCSYFLIPRSQMKPQFSSRLLFPPMPERKWKRYLSDHSFVFMKTSSRSIQTQDVILFYLGGFELSLAYEKKFCNKQDLKWKKKLRILFLAQHQQAVYNIQKNIWFHIQKIYI